MVEAARLCASSPHEATHQDALRHAAEEIRAATTNASTPAMRARTITRLEVSLLHLNYCFCITAYFIHCFLNLYHNIILSQSTFRFYFITSNFVNFKEHSIK